jgi:hypothetical protein
MRDAIQAALRRVRSRQQTLFALRCVVVGLIAGAVGGLAVGLTRQALDQDISRFLGAAVMIAGPVLGLIVGLSFRRDWHGAAAAVDAHYGLKDRSVTALAFAAQSAPTELQSIQMKDALSHLNRVQPELVVPFRVPRAWPVALASLAVAVGALALGVTAPEVQAGPAPLPEHIAAMAAEQKAKLPGFEKKITETTQDLEDEKADEDKKALKELFEKLTQKLEEIDQAGVDEKEALVKLNEMEADRQSMANQLNVAALDGQLSKLGEALAAATAFEGAGKALQEGKLEKAAKELEKLDEVKLTPKEEKALEEKLKQLAKQMGDAGQGSLSEAAAELAEALKSGNGKVGNAARNLAKKINNAVKRKKANDLLTQLGEELKDAKCQCQNSGGAKIKQPSKSNDPSSTWGRAISGNTDGEKTKLNGKRNEVQVTGTPGGEGDSDVETTATPEARQKAAREYREKIDKFQKEISEAVIDGEPIPIGHRQMVKRYFESIRPSSTDPTEKPATPEKK